MYPTQKKYISNIWKYFFFIAPSWGLITPNTPVSFSSKWYDETVCMIFVETSLISDLYYKPLESERDAVVERFEFNVRYSSRRKFSFNFKLTEPIILVSFSDHVNYPHSDFLLYRPRDNSSQTWRKIIVM